MFRYRMLPGAGEPPNHQALITPTLPPVASALPLSPVPEKSSTLSFLGGRLPAEMQQLIDLLDNQIRLREVAQAERGIAMRSLVDLAESVCVVAWDEEKRRGANPESWPPAKIAEFIRQQAREALRRVDLSHDPQLLEKFQALAAENATLQAENSRLSAQVQNSQASIATLSNRLAELNATLRVDSDKAQSLPLPLFKKDEPSKIAADETEVKADAPGELADRIASVPPERIDDLLKLIASTGLARRPLISEKLALAWNVGKRSSAVHYAIRAAEQQGLLRIVSTTVEWKGGSRSDFIVPTELGHARAVELGITPIDRNEYIAGIKRHMTPEQLYLVLKAADILTAEGYTDVNWLPEGVTVEGGDYCPDITAWENGHLVYIECERSRDKARGTRWESAAQVNGGIIRLISPNMDILQRVVGEINAVTANAYRTWAFTISDYQADRRGPDGSLWFYQR